MTTIRSLFSCSLPVIKARVLLNHSPYPYCIYFNSSSVHLYFLTWQYCALKCPKFAIIIQVDAAEWEPFITEVTGNRRSNSKLFIMSMKISATTFSHCQWMATKILLHVICPNLALDINTDQRWLYDRRWAGEAEIQAYVPFLTD